MATLVLAENLDLSAAGPLHGDLSRLRGHAVTVDAANVERLGALCLQVLLAAARAWAADGQPFTVAASSASFDATVALFGAPPFDIAANAGVS
jgi:chemotaxis protein CheX